MTKWNKTRTSRMPSNQQKVRMWLESNDRKPCYLAKLTKVTRTTISCFLQNKYVSNNVLIRISRATGLQMELTFGDHKQKIKLGK